MKELWLISYSIYVLLSALILLQNYRIKPCLILKIIFQAYSNCKDFHHELHQPKKHRRVYTAVVHHFDLVWQCFRARKAQTN